MFETKNIVSYSNVDYRAKLNLLSIVNYFQDCSTLESETIQRGVEDLHKENLVWVLSSWKLEVTRYPVIGEKITVGTFPYEYKGFFGKRQYYMKDEEGKIVALADTLWVLLNYKENTPAKITDDVIKGYVLSEKIPMEEGGKGKILIPESMEEKTKVKAGYHHIDANMHVNNGKYIEMLLDELKVMDYSKVRIEYRKMARLGDILTPCVGAFKDKTVALLRNEDGENCVVMELV